MAVFVTGTQIPAPLFSDDGITPKANPVTTNSQGQFDFFIADGRYDLTVSGPNFGTTTIQNVEISGITEANAADLPWITENLRYVNQGAVPTAPAAGTIELYSLTTNKHLYMQDETGAITDLTTGGGGGGSNLPGAPTNALQKNSGASTFIASNVVDDGLKVHVNSDIAFKGPNPYTDVTAFGVRGIVQNATPAIAGITGNINSGSNILSVSTASCPGQTNSTCFVNGDGVIVIGAGPANTLSTPGTPTVTPSTARVGTGTEDVVPGIAGTTNYQYQIVARDKLGGLTPASAVGATTTGQASLGSQSVAILSATASGTTVTVTTVSAHTLVPGAHIMIAATAGGNSCIGGFSTFQVATVPDNTHFTYQQGVSTANGGATSFNGTATVYWMNCNHITWTAVPGAWQYYIYGRSAGSMALLGVTHPSDISYGTDTAFDDFGPIMMASSTLGIPSYVPAAPPLTALPDPLITTITSGAGTTTLTLAGNAGTSVSGASVLFTNGPNILAATSVANNLYWPAIGNSYVVNSFTDVFSISGINSSWMYTGGLVLNETMTFGGNWEGQKPNTVTGNNGAQFNFMGEPVITTVANPGVFVPNAAGFYDRLAFVGGQNPMFMVGRAVPSGPQFGQHMYFGTSGSSDYMGIALYITGVSGGNGMRAGRISISTGPGQQGGGFTGSTFTPSVYVNGGGTTIDSLFMQDRGLLQRSSGSGGQLKLNSGYTQGGIQPFITVTGNPTQGGLTGVVYEIQHIVDDTTFQPFLSYLPSAGGLTGTIVVGNADGAPGGGTPQVTGPVSPLLFVLGAGGQNTGTINGSNFTDTNVQVVGTGAIGSIILPQALSGCIATSGGNVPVGQHNYSMQVVDAFGRFGPIGPNTPITILTNNQSVTCSPPAAPPGGIGWYLLRDGQVTAFSSGNGPVSFNTNGVDSAGFTSGAPTVSASYVNAIAQQGIEANKIMLTGGGFSSAISGTFTANRTMIVPDSNVVLVGTSVFANLGTPANGTFNYCSDCTIASPCAGGGTGALAKRLNGIWVCN